MPSTSASDSPLPALLPGTWRLLSRIDVAPSGLTVPDPALGSDPIALLIYDRAGNFSAQFMKRDRSAVSDQGFVSAKNNTLAQSGYDAYFGIYSVDDAAGVVTQTLLGSLSNANVGAVLSRAMSVRGDSLIIKLDTTATDGTPIVRTLTWQRVG
jgi:Lipocalin-like domain